MAGDSLIVTIVYCLSASV